MEELQSMMDSWASPPPIAHAPPPVVAAQPQSVVPKRSPSSSSSSVSITPSSFSSPSKVSPRPHIPPPSSSTATSTTPEFAAPCANKAHASYSIASSSSSTISSSSKNNSFIDDSSTDGFEWGKWPTSASSSSTPPSSSISPPGVVNQVHRFGAPSSSSSSSSPPASSPSCGGGGSSKRRRCQPVCVGGATDRPGITTSEESMMPCSNLRCTKCDMNVLVFSDYSWDNSTSYVFIRTSYPVSAKLREHMQKSPGCAARCCQCQWSSDKTVRPVDPDLRWVCGGHL